MPVYVYRTALESVSVQQRGGVVISSLDSFLSPSSHGLEAVIKELQQTLDKKEQVIRSGQSINVLRVNYRVM